MIRLTELGQLRRMNILLRRQRIILVIILIACLIYMAVLFIGLEKNNKATEELVQAHIEYKEEVERFLVIPRIGQAATEVEEVVEAAELKPVKPIKFNVSAYCPCIICCGKTDGITKSGVKAKANKTIAMDKSYPMGTQVTIEGFDNILFEKQDIGGAIKGNKIDIFFDTHQEALDFGRQQLDVYIIEPEGLELTQDNN